MICLVALEHDSTVSSRSSARFLRKGEELALLSYLARIRRMSAQLLDSWRNPESEVRIAVEAWWAVQPILGQYITRRSSPRMVWSYALRIGPIAVWRKIRSRLAETRRNDKVAGVGIGYIIDAPRGSTLRRGDRVVFFAPNHSTRWPRITLDLRLTKKAGTAGTAPSAAAFDGVLASLRHLIGWSPYSGVCLNAAEVDEALQRLADAPMVSLDALVPAPSRPSVAHERLERQIPHGQMQRRTAVLFGLGNYAKTQILPAIRRHLTVAAVHEIDPDQLEAAASLGVTLDTCPWPRDGETYDAWFISGFHHSHAPLAAQALDSGAYAIVEKPLVTSRLQFEQLRNSLHGDAASRLFSCFHKRYSRLHDWALADLGTEHGQPVDMHCIVYEIPLPPLHWYNWPHSGSRLVSNGCHWLDYFLYVNDYSAVTEYSVKPMRDKDLAATVRLVNGAQFAMSLTDRGSERLGVRDVLELRAGRVTVRLVDATYYVAERSDRVLRNARVNPMAAYRRMYDTICQRISAGAAGDPPESLRSTALMLDMEDTMQASRNCA